MNRITMAFGIFVICCTAAASAADFPARKPGLWKITITGEDSFTVRQCSDAASDEALEQASFGGGGECAKRDLEKSGSTITVTSACTSSRKTTILRMVITGSLDSNYTMTISRQGPGRSAGPSMALSAKWLGPCIAGQKPGDVIMPGGTKINILNVRKGVNSAVR